MTSKNPKILHLGFHQGLENELYSLSNELKLDLIFKNFHFFLNNGSADYSVGHDKAKIVWDKFKDYFTKFDIIITSDTAPISRVFLQNGWPEISGKKLIIWVCNRFDYFDNASKDCLFPDREYYDLIRQANSRKNVHIMGYTPFENYYGKMIKKVNFGNDITKPIGILSDKVWSYKSNPNRLLNDNPIKDIFFIPPYHNDTKMMNLSQQLTNLGILNYSGRYNGPLELSDFKGVIHIPYAWSNLALFEAFQLGIIYFIPSLTFMKQLSQNRKFFWSPPFNKNLLYLSEWYCEENKDMFVYFDNWKDLQEKILTLDYEVKKNKILEFGKNHKEQMLNKWKKLIL